jgi:uncharacterized membrane protein
MANGNGAGGRNPAAATAPRTTTPTTEPTAPLARVVGRNIGALMDRRRAEEARGGFEERLADAVTRFAGSMRFVYLHLAVVAVWVVANAGWVPALPRFDPTFVILATAASVESIFLSTFILISQNRMQSLADRRSDLDLQVSLLAEHEVTRLITLVTAMAARMGVEEARDPELGELARDVAPEKVLDQMESMERVESMGSAEEGAAGRAGPKH